MLDPLPFVGNRATLLGHICISTRAPWKSTHFRRFHFLFDSKLFGDFSCWPPSSLASSMILKKQKQTNKQYGIRGINKSSRNFITVLDFILGIIGRGPNGMALITKINLPWPEMRLSFQMCSFSPSTLRQCGGHVRIWFGDRQILGSQN